MSKDRPMRSIGEGYQCDCGSVYVGECLGGMDCRATKIATEGKCPEHRYMLVANGLRCVFCGEAKP